MLVSSFDSPPSCMMMKQLPPASMYYLMFSNSWPVKGYLGPPRRSKLERASKSIVNSPLLISHYRLENLNISIAETFDFTESSRWSIAGI